MKILVIQQKRIGDVLISSLICNALKKQYPNSTIDMMCYPNCVAVLEGNPNISSIITLNDSVRKSYPKLLGFIRQIRASKYDAVIDVYCKLETQLITGFSGAKYRISYKKGITDIFYSHPIERFPKWTKSELGAAIENRLRLMQPLIPNKVTDFRPKIFLSETEINQARTFLQNGGINLSETIGMIGILGSEWYKTYPLEKMAELLDFTVAQTQAQLLFNYIPSQLEEAKKLYDLCQPETQKHIFFDLFAKDLRGFLGLLSQCQFLIGNEGGAVNMAKALMVPTFSIFSPSVDKETWQILEDEKNISVHLKDFKPEIYEQHDEKYIKEHTFEFFAAFPEGAVKNALNQFIKAVF